MDWNIFRDQISHSAFFEHVERSDPEEQRACLLFLRLLRTDVILDWAQNSSAVRKQAGIAGPVWSLLLRRYLLHLGHRRDPAALGEFWRKVVPQPALADLWDTAGLPDTLDLTLAIPEQEARFATVLVDAAERVKAESSPAWACDTLQALARQRALHDREHANNATVRVVFGWKLRDFGCGLRSGLLPTFTLLAESGYDLPIKSPHVFAATFLDAIRDEVRQRVHRSELRCLDHDWKCLGEGVLTGTSGTLAIWLAQFLAAGGMQDRRWTLPPWVQPHWNRTGTVREARRVRLACCARRRPS
jgi:hypothetical protein